MSSYTFKHPNQQKISFDIKKDPHGGIQLKGTEICIDVHCECGHSSHFDGFFVFFVQCPKCNTVYEINPNVALIKRNPTEVPNSNITQAETE